VSEAMRTAGRLGQNCRRGVRDSWVSLISKPHAGRRRGGPRQGAAETVRTTLAMSRF
jgi:hypothetical protein